MKLITGILCALTATIVASADTAQAQTLPLPKPTGRFAVGVMNRILVDTTRAETNTPEDSTDRREVSVRVWYPAAATRRIAAAYLADSLIWIPNYGRPFFATTQRARTNSIENAPPLTRRWPVILFEPGNGQAPEFYTTILEDLASHGFIVIGLSHPYDFQPVRLHSGAVAHRRDPKPSDLFEHVKRLVALRAADMQFVLRNGLAPLNLDRTKVVAIGHSRGGVTVFEACKQPGFLACLNLDGGVLGGAFYDDSVGTGLKAPAMWLQMIHEVPSDAKLAEYKLSRLQWDSFDIRANRMLARGPAAWRMVLNATSHMGFSDRDYLQGDAADQPNALKTVLEVRTIVTRFAEIAICGCFEKMAHVADAVPIVSQLKLTSN